jgi:hypothetical protein
MLCGQRAPGIGAACATGAADNVQPNRASACCQLAGDTAALSARLQFSSCWDDAVRTLPPVRV